MLFAFIEKLVSSFSVATSFLLVLFFVVVVLFNRAHKNPEMNVRWEDLVVDTKTLRVNPYKFGYVIGVVVGTWVVVTLTTGGTISWDMMIGYFAFLLGGSGWNSYIKGRFADTPPSQPNRPVKTALNDPQEQYPVDSQPSSEDEKLG